MARDSIFYYNNLSLALLPKIGNTSEEFHRKVEADIEVVTTFFMKKLTQSFQNCIRQLQSSEIAQLSCGPKNAARKFSAIISTMLV